MNHPFHIRIVFFAVACWIPIIIFGQQPSNYYQLPLLEDQMVERTIALDSAVVISQVESFTKADYIPSRRYIVLDDDLKLRHDSMLNIPFRNKRIAQYTSGSSFNELFYDYRKGNYSLVKIDKQSIHVEEGRLPNKMYEPQIVIAGHKRFLLDRRVNKERVYVTEHGKTPGVSTPVTRIRKRTKLFPLFFDAIANSENVSYIWKEQSRKWDEVHAVIWSDDGTLLHRFDVNLPNKTIHSIAIRQVDEDRYMLTGTYAQHQTKMASGAFMALIEDGAMMQVNLYSFSELPHYFDYLDKYDKEAMSRKLARLKKHEKNTEIRTHAAVHKVEAVGETYLLPIEFYEESYTNQYGVTRNGNTIAGTPQTLKGYEYSHAIILRFDLDGQLKHDYYVPIDLGFLAKKNDTKLLTEVVEDTLLLGYAAKNHLYFGTIKTIEFAKLEKVSAVDNEADSVVRKEARFVYMSGGDIFIYGFKTTKTGNGLKKKAEIYFIETRKVR